ncbi:type II/IV secretion system protein [Candidatus Peregrinibacteria bacterium]|nr:type II/IV secretion system protein [Candidatus Peregrinibacteria bacterium]
MPKKAIKTNKKKIKTQSNIEKSVANSVSEGFEVVSIAPEIVQDEVTEWKIHRIYDELGNYTDELNEKIIAYLSKYDLISPEQIKVINDLHSSGNDNIVDIIVSQGFMKEDAIGHVLANFFQCNYKNLKDSRISAEVIRTIPEKVARNEMAIVFEEDEEKVYIAMLNPSDKHFTHLVEKKTGKKVGVYYSTPKQIQTALKQYKKSLKDSIDKLIEQASQNIERLDTLDDISAIFDTLILMAYDRGSSDIHIEPSEQSIQIRFRIDGVLGVVTTLPLHFLDTIVNHVKVLAKLRTDEHSSAQDGRFSISYDQTNIFLRVSVLPINFGEKIVMRLLPAEAQELTLTDLGYASGDKELIEKVSMKSSGIILVTGPTGSGKTTTLYSLIKHLNDEKVNISTIEDPIEYGIQGINQVQVNAKTNLTFAEGLKSLLRQDPDIIMVGEIRDNETAKIAMNASLTGHLVFSTLHTNSASLAPLRMIQMGVDPYLIVSTVNLIIAQRLIRTICPHCKASVKKTKDEMSEYKKQFLVSDEDKKLFEKFFSGKKGDRLFVGKGCKKCGNTGYKGRTVVAEALKIKNNIRELIEKQATESDIRETAKKNGMTSMLEDGFLKITNGITTLDELFRVLNQ